MWLAVFISCCHSNAQLKPSKRPIQIEKRVNLSSRTSPHPPGIIVQISSRVLQRNAQWRWSLGGKWGWGEGGWPVHCNLPAPRSPFPIPRLIHWTPPLYTALDVVSWILWRTPCTTTSSSPHAAHLCFRIHAPRKTSVTFHKRRPIGARLLLGQWKAGGQSRPRQTGRRPIACGPRRE